MWSINRPQLAKHKEKNSLGLTPLDYTGAPSTLCAGCGHDGITAAIIQACYELSIPPHKVVKLSGIGCSSKTPAYFLSKAHGFNSVHGRMATIATGASIVQPDLYYLGVSGDGDTCSIGLSHFLHAMRRNIDMLYIIENNGVYGLTKGQFSATSKKNAMNFKKSINHHEPIDPVELALTAKAPFVARSFSQDKDDLIALIKAGLLFEGFALLDVYSPCVSFNHHAESGLSYPKIRENKKTLSRVEIKKQSEISLSVPGWMSLRAGWAYRVMAEPEFDYQTIRHARNYLEDLSAEGILALGLFHLDDGRFTYREEYAIEGSLRSSDKEELSPAVIAQALLEL